MFVVHEKAGLDRDASLAYWRTTHADLVRKVPGVVGYVQHHAVAAPGTIPFLGAASLTFTDEAAFGAAAASQEFAAAIADVANFGDQTTLPTAFVDDVVIV